ncbi:fibronectin type III domain-containing protein [[Clostridium] colinum]|uniref:fibronectin type III domain-containing protein n=1 Tax=[Clostridium] colinum TaxID=36835 RepID=UPI00202589ED|nr:fibronectin type III domain-containing protein [[Clostridium] colinum]
MKRITAKILLFVIIVNAMLANITLNIFANNANVNARAKSAVNFEWNKTSTLNEKLDVVNRDSNSDEVFLSWDIDKIGNTNNTSGTYTLTYPIADDKEIEFKVTRKNDKSQITYKVNGENTVNEGNKKLYIYKEGSYLLADNKSFPESNIFKLDSVYKTGKASKVSFEIGKTGGATFQYEGNTIKFLWKDGKMYFVTNGVKRGNIYPFKLEYTTNGNNKETEEKKISLGIDTEEGFEVKPFANKDDKNDKGKELIDQTGARPITEYPGGKIVGVDITFNTLKEWKPNNQPPNGNKGKYEFEDNTKATEMIFNIGHADPTKKLQLKIANIYSDNNITITNNNQNVNGKITATYKYDDKTHTGTITLEGLEASTLYSDISISTTRADSVKDENKFETIEVPLPVGTIYTYPAYRIVALGASEYYLELEPFKVYDGYYRVSQGSQQDTLSSWYDYAEKNKGKDKILIPVSLDASAPQEKFFKIDFSFTPFSLAPTTNKQKITSQILKFKPYKEDIVLATPKNLKVVKANIVKKDSDPENLFLTLKWDIDYEEVLKILMEQHKPTDGSKFNIDYTFYKGAQPDKVDDELLKVNLEFEGNGSNKIKYTIKNGKDNHNIEIINEDNKTFTSERTEVINGKSKKIVEANVTFKIPVSEKGANDQKILEYSNTYFLATKAEYTIKPAIGAENKYETGLSLPVTLTLNGIEDIEVPAPQNIKVDEKSVNEKSFTIEYDTLKYETEQDLLYNYNEIMLKTIGRYLKEDSIKYDFYITQSKQLFDELVKYSKDEEIPENIKNKINKYINSTSMSAEGITIDFKTISGEKGLVLDTLRQKGIVQISGISQNKDMSRQKLNFSGLDENETYYIIGRTNVIPYEKKAGANGANGEELLKEKLDYSKFSKLVTVTTRKDGDTPSEDDKVPPTPTKFEAQNITLNSVNLIWDRVKDNLKEDEEQKSTLEYQFIKVKGTQLPDSFLKSKYSYEKTWENLSNVKNKEGLKTNQNKLYEFDTNSKSFSKTEASKDRYEYVNWQGSEGNILDKTLVPNQVYFYYIRTVRMVGDEEKAYSIWVPLTFTTKNTTGPKNLRVEPKAEYNKKSEVVISFDIPKMDTKLIGTEYDLQYSIKEDLGDWSKDTTMPKDKLTFKDNDDGKTMKVTYKITGLKSGKMYTIRVRMLNKPLNAPSIYSNEVEHRTDSDNADNDYDQDVNNWETNFKDKIEELKNEPYWFGKDTSSSTLVYYRPQYFDKVISTTNNSIIDLALGKGGNYKEYYLPASAVIKAFDENKGFRVSYNDAEVIFSPKTINPYDNDVIKKMAESIKSKNSNISDYFIKLTVDFKNNKYIIDGSDSISPSANITISVVGTKNKIVNWDQTMLNYIEELLKTKEFSKEVKDRISKLIKDKTDNKIMVQEIAKIVDSFKSKFGNELTKSLNNLSRKTEHIQYLAGDIIFACKVNTGISVSGYKKSQGNWISILARDYLGKKAIYVKETGEYIFAGKKLVINGVGNLPNGNKITEIVIKYGLDDYLGKNGNINLRAPITRRTTIGSLARVAGASKTQDPVEFFKTKNITLSNRNLDNNITSEEAVYLIMKVYEMKSGTKLETVKIRNYKLTQDIKNINTNYKKSIQVAFETGIYNNPNMNAKGTISVQEFLQSLVNMSTMLGI